MNKINGISLSISTYEDGIWFDSDKKVYHASGWGIKLDLVWGKLIRPIPYFWKKGYWQGLQEYNPWKGGKYLFILRLPFMIGPFLSIAVGKYGGYIGCKTFEITEKHLSKDRYGTWLKEGEAGTEAFPAEYLQFSASIRRTRWR